MPKGSYDDLARALRARAADDVVIVRKALSDLEISDWIVGFHAQQAAEKLLKAVLAHEVADFPFTHDLRELRERIEALGLTPPVDRIALNELTSFAVEHRYVDSELGLLDRHATAELLDALIPWADASLAEVKAAGGVVTRRAEDRRLEVAVVHRPKYDDWAHPKGKLDPGETFEQAALREVEEETGLRCRLGPELSPTFYRDPKGRSKVVRYWRMEPLGGEFAPSREVDELRWLALDEARDLLTYPRDRTLLDALGG